MFLLTFSIIIIVRPGLTLPSSCSTTITSIAPLKVAGLMEFHVLDTDPPILRTYCILLGSQLQSSKFSIQVIDS